MSKEILETERQLIYLFLHHKNLVEDWFESNLKVEHFHLEHQTILQSIRNSYDQDTLLTRKKFQKFIEKIKIPSERIEQEQTFNKCLRSIANENDFPLFVHQISENYVLRKTSENLKRFSQEKEQKGNVPAVKELVNNLQDLITNSASKYIPIFENISDYADKFHERIEGILSGKIKEEEKLLSGIKEIDETMVTGFMRGTLTLFCADVGAFKSTILLNIALNIWKNGHNVLFVPLEMTGEQMYTRALARESKVHSDKLYNIPTLNNDERIKLDEAKKQWLNLNSKFYILELPERTSVSSIRRQIDKHIDIFKPRLVVIDYIANLTPDTRRSDRNDLEIGDMLKDLRQMGKTLDFAVVSAAQLGREALKRIRRAGASRDKASINSEDIRGSHEYAADSDNIYAQLINTSQPDGLLDLYVVKARQGKKIFSNNKLRATLEVNPEIGLIKTQGDYSDIGGDQSIDEMFEADESNEKLVNKDSLFDGGEEDSSSDDFDFLDN